MAAREDVEQHQVKGDQGDADGHVGGSHEPVHASIFNQISLNSQDPDVVVRSASTQRLPLSVVRTSAPVPANVNLEFASTRPSYWLKKGRQLVEPPEAPAITRRVHAAEARS